MKVCVYLELEKYFDTSGIGTAVDNQRKALRMNGIEVTSDPSDDYDVIHINTIGPKSFYLSKNSNKDTKVVIHAHTTAEDFRGSFLFSDKISPILKKYLKYYYDQADILLCPSRYTKEKLDDYDLSLDPKIISNGIDTERFGTKKDLRSEYRRRYNVGEEETVVFSVGSVFMRKGIDTFSEVAKEFPDTQFIWFGPIYSKLQNKKAQKVVESSPSNVRFVGKIDDVLGAYSLGDIFFFPSYRENQGIVTLEAASSGKPLVLRDIPGFKFWSDEKDCYKGTKKEKFIKAIRKLIDKENLRKDMGRKAQETAKEHDLKKIGKKLQKIYQEAS